MKPPFKKPSDRLKQRTGAKEDMDENPFDLLRKKWFRWLNTKIGILGGALLVGCFGLWIEWDVVSKLPGVDSAATTWKEWRGLPQAKGDRFSIVIAQLDNDPDGVH